MSLTALETIAALRICGNHPNWDDKTCEDCPFVDSCRTDSGDAMLLNAAADTIEALMKELGTALAAREEQP